MNSTELIKLIEKDEWYKCHQKGSYCQFKHSIKTGIVTIPHPKKDLPIKTFKSILKQAGIENIKR